MLCAAEDGSDRLQGEVYHWTVSLGSSIAEASNFFTTAAGADVRATFAAWQAHVKEAGVEDERERMAASLHASMTEFGVI